MSLGSPLDAPHDSPRRPRFQLLAFVRSPVPELAPTNGGRVGTFVRLWLACLATALLTAPVALVASQVSGAANRVEEVPTAALAVLALGVAPLVEETGFRLPLARFRPAWLVLSGAALAFLMAPYGLVVLAVALVVAGAPPLRRAAVSLWAQRFPFVFWGSAVLFGLLHTANWELGGMGWRAIVVVPLLVLPQSGLGLVLGAARVRLGLGGAMLLHAAYNGTILGATLL